MSFIVKELCLVLLCNFTCSIWKSRGSIIFEDYCPIEHSLPPNIVEERSPRLATVYVRKR